MMVFVIVHNNEDNLHLGSVAHASVWWWVCGCLLLP